MKMTNDIFNCYKKLISNLSSGYGRRFVENPAIDFSKRAHNGEFNDLSDEEYEELLNSVKEESMIWLKKPNADVASLVTVMFENIDFTEEDVDRLMEVVRDAYNRTDMSVKPTMCAPVKSKDKTATGNNTSSKFMSNQPKGDGPKYPWDIYSEDEEIDGDYSTPKKIYDFLNTYVYGQDKAKKEAAMLMWNHMRGNKRNIVMAGPTGSGKTEIFRNLSKIYPNIAIFDATQFTGEGWKGSTKLKDIFLNAKCDDQERMIVVLDEADKMFEEHLNSSSNIILQNELLKLIEGDTVSVKADGGPMMEECSFDTSNISFVFMGSFENLMKNKEISAKKNGIGFTSNVKEVKDTDMYDEKITPEDLVMYANIRPEIAGRIDSIVQLDRLLEDDFYRILCDNKISPLKKAESQYNVNVKMSDAAKHELARKASENKMGVRYMNGYIRQALDDQMFVNCQKKNYVIE